VGNLNEQSSQGDKEVVDCLKTLRHHCTISAADNPDLIPILSIMAACNQGAVFTDIRRLRLKESDRVAATHNMITALGGRCESDENTLTVYGTGLTGGTVDSFGDHRIAMAAAIAATKCRETVTILGAQAVNKSYPNFWEDYRELGGKYEQYLR
jgi:3-phosphoshikimate 1-carboxyvinyltransferase